MLCSQGHWWLQMAASLMCPTPTARSPKEWVLLMATTQRVSLCHLSSLHPRVVTSTPTASQFPSSLLQWTHHVRVHTSAAAWAADEECVMHASKQKGEHPSAGPSPVAMTHARPGRPLWQTENHITTHPLVCPSNAHPEILRNGGGPATGPRERTPSAVPSPKTLKLRIDMSHGSGWMSGRQHPKCPHGPARIHGNPSQIGLLACHGLWPATANWAIAPLRQRGMGWQV